MSRPRRLASALFCVALLVAAPPLRAADAPAPVPAMSPASDRHQKWYEKVMLKAYDEVGHRDPKWDEPARQALRLSVDLWGAPRPRMGGDWPLYQAARRAIDAGCDDPMVRYVYARTYHTFGEDEQKCRQLHDQAADGLAHSFYTGYYKSLAQFRAAQRQFEMANEHGRAAGKYDPAELEPGLKHMSLGIGMMDLLGREKDVPVEQWLDLGDALQDGLVLGGGAEQLVEWALPEIEKRAPKVAALAIKGQFYTNWAWDARGTDFANNVTDQGWKLMAERLQVAQAALEEAWKLDPTCVGIPIRMIHVELGQGQGRDRMELWFKRAMAIDPDNDVACDAKLYYLEPKWYGTPADMLQFGRECLQTGRFNSKVPFMLERAHSALSHYTHGGYDAQWDPEYYKRPGVWADLKAVYDGYLAADKDVDPIRLRNQYANYACLCGAWEDAAKMFATIGDKVDLQVWSREEFDTARKAALANARP